MKIEAILKNIIFLDNGYFKYQEYQNLGIHSLEGLKGVVVITSTSGLQLLNSTN